MNNTKRESAGGYVALMSTLVISFILSAVVLSAGFESFWSRQNVLNEELKETSFNLAVGCLQKAVLIMVQSPSFEINDSNKILFSDMKQELYCELKSLSRENNLIVHVQAQAGKAVTNLKAQFDETDLEIISVEELPSIE